MGFSLNDKEHGEWLLRSELFINVSVFRVELSLFNSQLLNSNINNNNNNTANRPDIIIKIKEKTYTLLDVTINAGRNIVPK